MNITQSLRTGWQIGRLQSELKDLATLGTKKRKRMEHLRTQIARLVHQAEVMRIADYGAAERIEQEAAEAEAWLVQAHERAAQIHAKIAELKGGQHG